MKWAFEGGEEEEEEEEEKEEDEKNKDEEEEEEEEEIDDYREEEEEEEDEEKVRGFCKRWEEIEARSNENSVDEDFVSFDSLFTHFFLSFFSKPLS